MSHRKSPRISNDILEHASEWFVEVNSGNTSQSARDEFDGWLRTSPEHVRAYLQIASHWEEGSGTPRDCPHGIDELVAMARSDRGVVRLHDAQYRASHDGKSAVPKRRIGKANSSRMRVWAVAAAVLLAIFSSVLAWNHYIRGTYSTGIGEQRSLKLADGSQVELNSKSRIRVRYGDHERRIELLDGQALFRVAGSKSRPFIVTSESMRVRAIGTEFDVYRRPGRTTVTVLEGRVSVSYDPKPGAGSLIVVPAVDAGEQVVATPGAMGKPRRANIGLVTAWTQRRLIFRGAPLSDVIEEFNRYNAIPLTISDPELGKMQISASFSSSDPAALVRFLREVGAYEVEETASGISISGK